MTLEEDIAKTCIEKWFAQHGKKIVHYNMEERYVLGEDYAIAFSTRNHTTKKNNTIKTQANITPREILKFVDKKSRDIKKFHWLIVRTFYNHIEDKYNPDYCYFVEVPQLLLADRAQKEREHRSKGEDNLYFYFDEKGGRNNQYGMTYWQTSSYEVNFQQFNPEAKNTWTIRKSLIVTDNIVNLDRNDASPLPTAMSEQDVQKQEEAFSQLDEELSIVEKSDLSETEKEAIYKARVGHSELKDRVLKTHGKCRFCDISFRPILIASHVKPWSKCENKSERLAEANILLLCSTHDALFDKLIITFEPGGHVILSPIIDPYTANQTGIDKIERITFTSEEKVYLEWHQAAFIKKWSTYLSK